MDNFKRRVVFGVLFFIVAGVFLRLGYRSFNDRQYPAVRNFQVARAGDFAPGQLEAHYLKHGYQFGQITEEQYLRDAQALLDAAVGPDVLEKIRPNGDVEHFRPSTGEFAVMTKSGRIRTDFKTDYGYWITH